MHYEHPPTEVTCDPCEPIQRYIESSFAYDVACPQSLLAAVHRMKDEDIAMNAPGGGTYFFAATGPLGLEMIEQAKSERDYEARPPVTTCGFEVLRELVDWRFLAQALDQPYGEHVQQLLGTLHSTLPVVNILPVSMNKAKDFIQGLAGPSWAAKIVKPLLGFDGMATLAFPSLGHPTKRRFVEACSQAGVPAFFSTSANKTGEPTISDPALLQQLFPTVPIVADGFGDRMYLEFQRNAYLGFGSLTAVDWVQALDTGGYPTIVRVGSVDPRVVNEFIQEYSLIGNRVICPPGTKHLLPQVPTYTDLSATMQLFSSIDEMYSPLGITAEQRRRIAPNILYEEWAEPSLCDALPQLPDGMRNSP
jgi:hypothetical protein